LFGSALCFCLHRIKLSSHLLALLYGYLRRHLLLLTVTLTMALTVTLVARLLRIVRVLSQVISAWHPLHSSKARGIATTIGFVLCFVLVVLPRRRVINAVIHAPWLHAPIVAWLLWIWRSLLSLGEVYELGLEILLAVLVDGIRISIFIICTFCIWSHRGGV